MYICNKWYYCAEKRVAFSTIVPILYIYIYIYICILYSIPPDGGLQTCPKHVEVDWRVNCG